ncbi:unnamed protein product [Adineta steineri]|uniref:Uncharacterized protein n=1 Tax=Adineta steineri TaxID=433720 RepID=A0A815PJ16_9BILA|nr:unnamed protein product [Adineta steineri]CAF3549917.1 unnamed protein product [Adineta steineri]
MLLLHFCLICTIIPSFVFCNQSSAPIDQIILTLTRALNFFSTHIDQVNLDAGIGPRIAADQLRPYTMCKHCKSIKNLVDLSEHVTWKIIQSVRYRQPDYFQQVSFLVMPGTFSTIVPFEQQRDKYKIHIENKCSSSPFIEKYSDQCLHALINTKCNHTESCTKLMSDPYACRYSLTHQILYSIIVKQSLCYQQRLSSFNEHRLILKMLDETHKIANRNFLESDRDLFMEQIAFGGLVGWSDFFQNKNWFDSIINWQHPIQGCYGNDTSHHRNKREEMQMLHQCLSHRTSVAIAALSQILRYLLSSRDI